jgi:hypothetical protein
VSKQGAALGLSRVLFFSILLIIAFQKDFSQYSYAPQVLWNAPGLPRAFASLLAHRELIRSAEFVWWIVLALSALGIWTRIMMILSFLLGFLIMSIPVGFLSSHFQYYLPTVVLGIFACSKAHDFYSVDAWLLRKHQSSTVVADPSDYSWTRSLILFNVSMMYFAAGLAKIRYSGFSWASAKSFLRHLGIARDNFHASIPEWTNPLFEAMVAHPWLASTVGSLVLALELSSPITFFYSRLRPYYLIGWVLLHLGIAFFMGITVSFWFIPIFFIILPWEGRT